MLPDRSNTMMMFVLSVVASGPLRALSNAIGEVSSSSRMVVVAVPSAIHRRPRSLP